MTAQLYKALDLDNKGWELVPSSSAAALDDAITKACEQKQGFIAAYWAPTSLLAKYPMMRLEMAHDDAEWARCTSVQDCPDPKPNHWAQAEMVTLASKDFADRTDIPDVMDYLGKRSWTQAQVSALMMWMTKSQTSIEIRNLYKIFGTNPKAHLDAVKGGLSKEELGQKHGHILGLNDINILMPVGKTHVIMGLSGSGKSTLIRHINRLIEPTAGQVLIDGRDILAMDEKNLREFRRLHTAMVFQKFALLPHRTVIDNVAFGLEVRAVSAAQARDTELRWIERVGLKGLEARYPNELSGGMQQRVGLAGALANDASILLMDEAYSALDTLIRTDMQTMLLDRQKELGKTVVFITHDLDEALRLGDQIVILRDGRIVQKGDSQSILLNPADDYIHRFIRDVNRGRFLRVEAVMERSLPAERPGLPRLAVGTVLEAAASELTRNGQDAASVEEDGRTVGLLTLRMITAALSAEAYGRKTRPGLLVRLTQVRGPCQRLDTRLLPAWQDH